MRHDQRRAWVEVDLDALKRNASMLAQRARVPLLPMVKADAYGLGVEAVVWADPSVAATNATTATPAVARTILLIPLLLLPR